MTDSTSFETSASKRSQPPIDAAVQALADAGAPWPAVAAAAAEAKLGQETIVIDVGDAIGVTDHFVISNGGSNRQVKAIVNEIEYQLKAVGGPAPVRIEGLESNEWVLVDYAAFVVHVFSPDARAYYSLERLWKDCDRLDWRALADLDSLGPSAVQNGETTLWSPSHIPEADS